MPGITLRIIDGADRGRAFENLVPPITIGREEGNIIQLNDERVSRFHLKIQEDNDRLVLTDLESTNGTKVNNEDIQLRILRFGDIIAVGRSVLLYGSREQIAGRLARLRGDGAAQGTSNAEEASRQRKLGAFDFELNWNADAELQATLYTLEPPELPTRLSPGQAAQLSELLDYLHIRIRSLLNSTQVEPKADRVIIDLRQWQSLVDLQSRLAEFLRDVSDPNSADD